MHGSLVAGAIYQLDWSALRMGALPFGVGESPERVRDAMVELIRRVFHPVPRSPRVGATQAFRRGHVEQQRQVRNEAARRQPVRGSHLLFRQTPPENLVSIRGKEK